MKFIQVSAIVMMLGMTCLSAQNRLHSIQNFRGSVDGSLLLPSTLNLGQHKAQWSSSGQYWFGNSFVSKVSNVLSATCLKYLCYLIVHLFLKYAFPCLFALF